MSEFTDEDQRRLDQLQAEREERTQKGRDEIFAKLPYDVREKILDLKLTRLAHDAIEEIIGYEAPDTDEEKALNLKQAQSIQFIGVTGSPMSFNRGMQLTPQYIGNLHEIELTVGKMQSYEKLKQINADVEAKKILLGDEDEDSDR